MSSSRASGNSFVPANQFDFQSWMTDAHAAGMDFLTH